MLDMFYVLVHNLLKLSLKPILSSTWSLETRERSVARLAGYSVGAMGPHLQNYLHYQTKANNFNFLLAPVYIPEAGVHDDDVDPGPLHLLVARQEAGTAHSAQSHNPIKNTVVQ